MNKAEVEKMLKYKARGGGQNCAGRAMRSWPSARNSLWMKGKETSLDEKGSEYGGSGEVNGGTYFTVKANAQQGARVRWRQEEGLSMGIRLRLGHMGHHIGTPYMVGGCTRDEAGRGWSWRDPAGQLLPLNQRRRH